MPGVSHAPARSAYHARMEGNRPLAMGCMRLSTDPGRDEGRAIEVIHAALDAGARLFDTADAYAWDASET